MKVSKSKQLKAAIVVIVASLLPVSTPARATTLTCATGGVCAIGDTGPGGGVVFFVKSSYTNTSVSTQNGTRTTSLTSQELAALPFDYLEAAPIGWDASSATDPIWNYNGSNSSGYSTIINEKIGTGRENTALMRSLNPTDTAANNIAYKLAVTSIGGFSDWWLPSNQELILMFTNLYKASPRLGQWSDLANLAYRTSTGARFFVFRWSAAYEGNNFKFDTSAWPYPVKPIRGFSAQVASSGSNENSNALAKAEALKREEQRRVGRAEIISAVVSSSPLTTDHFAKAEINGVTQANIVEVQAAIAALPQASRADITQVLKIARKFEVVGIVASDRVTSVYPNNLVEIGLIPADSKHKAAITKAIKNLPIDERSSCAAIKEAIDAEMAEIQARKDRLTAILALIASRRAP